MLTLERVKELRSAGVNSCSPGDFRILCDALVSMLERTIGEQIVGRLERHVEMLGSLDDKVADALRNQPESFSPEPARVDEL